ncbi:hypothetical protein FAUST_8074 [Fusarium austroamericanum]|uniref:DUF6536 domain-containing protein n=1 Tax=Fusarium austroamericanum TaxID=282268 RepID=A0AAN5Z5C5_FUSAU|nr:hypothetical protein FAUST_8074 [Fusarium austroamericanum]
MNLWIHLAINIIGTCILASSNFFMQRLVAPVRADVDAAHRSGHWLEIGVPSVSNFRFLKRLNIFYWLLFCLSSVPLQLVLNGVVIESKSTNSATIVLGAAELAKGGWHEQTPIVVVASKTPDYDYTFSREKDTFRDMSMSLAATETRGNWEKITFQDCMKRYNNPDGLLTHYRNVLFIMADYDDLALTSAKGWRPGDILTNTTHVSNLNEPNPLWGFDDTYRDGIYGSTIQNSDSKVYDYRDWEAFGKTPIENGWRLESTANMFDPVSGTFITDPKYFASNYRVMQIDHCISERFASPCQVSIVNSALLIVCVMCGFKSAKASYETFSTGRRNYWKSEVVAKAKTNAYIEYCGPATTSWEKVSTGQKNS